MEINLKIFKNRQFQIVVAILALSVIVFSLLKFMKRPVEKKAVSVLAPLVTVMELQSKDVDIIVDGFGSVTPVVEVEIVPQVSGNIVSLHNQFRAGGVIAANETIVKIDPRDYELAVRQAKADVAKAAVDLETEQAEAQVAQQEWYQLNPDKEPTSPLVLREPQIKQAQAQLESATAKLETAELNLSRTNIELPVNACIATENADLGQFVSAGKSIGRAFGVKKMEVEVPLEDSDLAWIDIPSSSAMSNGKSKKGSDVIISSNLFGKSYVWAGKIVRTTGQVDVASRQISVVIEIDAKQDFEKPTLLPGSFVKVEIQGKTIKNVFALPRTALHEYNHIWIAKDGKIQVRQLEIIYFDNEFAYVQDGLKNDEMIIASSLDVAFDGMEIRIDNSGK